MSTESIQSTRSTRPATLKRIPMRRIRALANQIGRTFNADRVILFGSYAYGRPKPESDVDLLVVMDSGVRNIEQAVTISRKLDHHFALDLIVRTPSQLRERLELGDFFLRDIVEKGKVLYARPDA